MKIKRKLSITSEEFFNFLCDSTVEDVKQHTEKHIKREDIVEGLSSKKTEKMKKREIVMKFTILEFVPNKKYVASITKNNGKNIVSFEIEELKDEKIRVTYSEKFIPINRVQERNFKFLNFVYKNNLKRKIKKTLKQAERYIINNRIGLIQ